MKRTFSRLSVDERTFASEFIDFLKASPSHFHATTECARRYEAAGFKKISETEVTDWDVTPGGKYYFTRNQSSIFAFIVGKQYTKGNGFNIQGAHTDSPVFKVKPISKQNKLGYMQVGVECYGGGLWNTWFDRDLSIAGRVIVEKDGKFVSELVKIDKPILRIPNLAIHLNREIYDKGFKINKETHCVPILATEIKNKLEAPAHSEDKDAEHHSVMLELVANELNTPVESIKDFELCLYDTQPAALSGVYDEFVVGRGLDNLCMSYLCMRALIDSAANIEEEPQIRMVTLFDNEEVGSSSCMGAASNMLSSVLNRLNADPKTIDIAIRKSLLISADMAHGVHPNYSEKHEAQHRPYMHKGLVIKQNANQRYATSSVTSFLMAEIARKNDIYFQKFVVRQDMGCGSTIGPILASSCGIRTIDVGVAQLSMHSIREMCGTADLLSSYQLLKAIFEEFAALDAKVENTD